MHALSAEAGTSAYDKSTTQRAPALRRPRVGASAGAHELHRVATRRAVLGESRCACGGLTGPTGECAACRARREAAQARPAVVAEVEIDDDEVPADEQPAEEATPAEPAQTGPLPDEHPGELWDTLTGKTGCTLPGGTPFSTLLTTKCTVGCTAQHEAVHFTDIAPCCAKAGVAHAKAADDEAKAAVEASFGAWLKLKPNENWFENRAYEKSVSCADKALAAKKCWTDKMAPKDRECCKDTVHYRRSSESQRLATSAAAPAALTACPFP